MVPSMDHSVMPNLTFSNLVLQQRKTKRLRLRILNCVRIVKAFLSRLDCGPPEVKSLPKSISHVVFPIVAASRLQI